MTYVTLAGFSRLGDRPGIEEWLFEESRTSTTGVEGITGQPHSRFGFAFEGRRYLNGYLLRNFALLGLIILRP